MAPARPPPQPFSKDERVLCFHHEMLYEAKILDIQLTDDGEGYQYKIHYKGWKNTWDDWVPVDRVRKFTEQNKELASQLHSQMKNLQKSSSKIIKKGGRINGTDSARGSEERGGAGLFSSGRGPRRARDYDLEQDSVNTKSTHAYIGIFTINMSQPKSTIDSARPDDSINSDGPCEMPLLPHELPPQPSRELKFPPPSRPEGVPWQKIPQRDLTTLSDEELVAEVRQYTPDEWIQRERQGIPDAYKRHVADRRGEVAISNDLGNGKARALKNEFPDQWHWLAYLAKEEAATARDLRMNVEQFRRFKAERHREIERLHAGSVDSWKPVDWNPDETPDDTASTTPKRQKSETQDGWSPKRTTGPSA